MRIALRRTALIAVFLVPVASAPSEQLPCGPRSAHGCIPTSGVALQKPEQRPAWNEGESLRLLNGDVSDLSATGLAYYVNDVNGDDSRSGRSPASAWRTLRRASAAPLHPGDRLLLKRGGSWSGTLTISSSGTPADPVTIDAFGTGGRPRLTTNGCLHLDGSYLRARHLRASNCDWSGFYIGGDHVRLSFSTASRNVAGIQIGYSADASSVLHNRLIDNNRLSDGNGQFGILVNGTNSRIARNVISGSSGSAVEIYGGAALNGGARIHHNTIRARVLSEMGKTTGNDVYYNVMITRQRGAKALVMHGGTSEHGPVSGIRFFNNTVYLPGKETQGWVCGGGCDATSLTLRNNIFRTTWKGGYADGPVNEDYNLYFGHEILQFTKGSHSFSRSARFVNPRSGNLRLRSSSPAIDRGVSTLARKDMDGVRVPFRVSERRPGVDRGAFEYHKR
jgi:hypothetical protein